MRFGAAEPRQPTSGLTFDQRLQRFPYHRGFLRDAGKFLRLGKQVVVNGDRGSHSGNSVASNIASSDAHFHAGMLRLATKSPELPRPASPARFPAARRDGTA